MFPVNVALVPLKPVTITPKWKLLRYRLAPPRSLEGTRISPDYRFSAATRNLPSGVYFSLVLTLTFPEND